MKREELKLKKDRNSFFTETSMYNQAGMNMQNPNMMYPNPGMPGPAPYPNQPMPQQPMPGPYPPGGQMPTPDYGNGANIEARIAKMERQIIRLETRLNKLENTSATPTPIYSNDDIDINNSTSMYMI